MSLLFPRKCILCRRVLRRQELDLCGKCRLDTEIWHDDKRKRQFLDSFTAVWYYEKSVRRSILRMKFHRARHLVPGFGRCLGAKLSQSPAGEADLVTWVPVSSLRRFTRGFDQGQLLAQALGRELGLPVRRTLKKIRHNRAQSSVEGAAQRRANVLGVYRVTDPGAVTGKRILLIDDVLTTGATAGECARMLLIAGAQEVHCAALAAVRKQK